MLPFRVSYRLILDTLPKKKRCFLGVTKLPITYSYLFDSLIIWGPFITPSARLTDRNLAGPFLNDVLQSSLRWCASNVLWNVCEADTGAWFVTKLTSWNLWIFIQLKRRVENSLMFWTFRIMKSSWCVDRVLRRRTWNLCQPWFSDISAKLVCSRNGFHVFIHNWLTPELRVHNSQAFHGPAFHFFRTPSLKMLATSSVRSGVLELRNP